MLDDDYISRAIEACQSGGVIAYPTESVFGLGCLPKYEHSVTKILELKKRSVGKGLICVAADQSQLVDLVDFDALTDANEVLATWPGPTTWLIPTKKTTPRWLTGTHDTLAVRVSAYPVVQQLCEVLGPLVSTSANPQNLPPAYDSDQVSKYFLDQLDYIYPASLPLENTPTEIRHGLTGEIIRISK